MDFKVLVTMDFETLLLQWQGPFDLDFLGPGSMDFEYPRNQSLLDFLRLGPMDFECPMNPAPRSGDLMLTASKPVKHSRLPKPGKSTNVTRS